VSAIGTDVLLRERYRLRRRIAVGGMGVVWEAEDQVLDRRVAVKVVAEALAADEQFVERFRREARAAAGLSHPNVAEVFDYGEDGDAQFMVMEFLEGETLAQRLDRTGPLPPEEAAEIAAQVAEALQAAHDAGVVHRDVKPANIMLTDSGVKVMDFGIAAATWAAPLTATGTTIGTATYLSPEQAAGDRATASSDLYSLGVVLFEVLAGRPPFVAESPFAVARAHTTDPAPPLEEIVPGVPQHLSRSCRWALEKDPAARPGSAALFAQLLRGGVDVAEGRTAPLPAEATPGESAAAPTEVIAPAATERVATRELRRQRPRWLLAAVVVGAVLLAGAVAFGLTRSGLEVPAAPTGGPTPAATVTVPKVAGLPVAEAQNRLDTAGLEVEAIREVDGEQGIVVRTDPPAGATLEPGATVILYVGIPPPTVEDDDDDVDEGDEGRGERGKKKKKRGRGGGD
jgi:tRNA A-37 threonylcarbamoyl transferase component Bud32